MPSTGRVLTVVVFLGAVGALLTGVLAYDAQDAAGRGRVQQEVAKLAFQFLLISVLGVLFKFLVDRYHDRAKRLDTLADYRQEMLRRLVGVTKRVRKIPVIVSAHRSASAYNEQMRALLDAYSELGEIRHDIDNQRVGEDNGDNIAFDAWPDIEKSLRAMERYLQLVLSEWQTSYSDLSQLQVRAEKRRRLQPQVWARIRAQPVFSGMLAEPRQATSVPHDGGEPYLEGSDFKARFLEPYYTALRLMRSQTLENPGR